MFVRQRKRALILLYIGAAALGIFLFFAFPDGALPHFLGASSLTYALIFFIAGESLPVSFLLLSWLAVFPLALLVCSLIAWKRQNYRPFSAVIILEIAISLLFLIVKLCMGNTFQLGFLIAGLLLRCVFGGWIVYELSRPEVA